MYQAALPQNLRRIFVATLELGEHRLTEHSENKICFSMVYRTSLRWLRASFEVLKSQYSGGENHKIKWHGDVGRRFQFIFLVYFTLVLFPQEHIRQICHIVQVWRRLKPKHNRFLCKSAARAFQYSRQILKISVSSTSLVRRR